MAKPTNLMFDWDYFTDFDDSAIILKELTKRDLALLSSAMFFLESETDWENGTWDTIASKLSETQHRISHDTYVCPPGGSADYNLISDIELVIDATTYELTDLGLISGVDLQIDLMLASADAGQRSLRFRTNGNDGSVYTITDTLWAGTTSYGQSTPTYANINRAIEIGATPQLWYSWVHLDFPDWKATDRNKLVHHTSLISGRHSAGRIRIADTTAIDSILFWASTGDIKAGSKIRVWARG